jgi:L-cysteine S-thiosulfotransferase
MMKKQGLPCFDRRASACIGGLIAFFVSVASPAAEPQRPQPLKSGIEFAGEDLRQLQADDFANPGMLWVERGAKLWSAAAGKAGKSCAECHGASDAMKGAATRYPRVESGRVVGLEERINLCRARHQQAEPLAYESDELLGLTAHVASQSRGEPLAVKIDDSGRAPFERGRAQYQKRIGQMNLACTHCHDQNWGRRLFAETISQGHGNAYPAYRLEWQKTGSLQRRIRACYFGVRAEMPAFGAQELLDLELYLAWRASGLPVETPGVRR